MKLKEYKALILEDDPQKYRMREFRNRFSEMYEEKIAKITYDHVEHSYDCIEALMENEYDFVFLDHDLNGQEMIGANEKDCGSRVADFLIERPDIRSKHGTFIVHSLNNVVAPEMARRIESEWLPAIFLREEWDLHIRKAL